MKAYFLVAMVLCSVAHAQSAGTGDLPLAQLDASQVALCPPGSIVLSKEKARELDSELQANRAKVAVYEKTPPLPWWAGVIIGVLAAGAGVGVTVAVYEAAKKP